MDEAKRSGNEIRFPFSIVRDRWRSLVSSSFDSGPYVACLVRMREDVLCYITWRTIIYSIYEPDFESP